MKREIVNPVQFSGWSMSILQIFGFGPKMTVECGRCYHVFKKRIPLIDYPKLKCPECGVLNKMPLVVEDGFL